MKIIKILSQKYQSNSYLIVDGESAVLIDCAVFVNQVEENLKLCSPRPKLMGILLTHEHFDHIAEIDNLISKYNCNVYIHENGKNSLYNENENMSIMAEPFKIKSKKEIKKFKDGEVLNFGDIEIKCHHTPGHSLGSSCFEFLDNMFTGDTVFKVDFGRSDLFGGDERVIRISLDKIKRLSTNINHFYAGHGSNFDKEDLEYNLEHYFGEI